MNIRDSRAGTETMETVSGTIPVSPISAMVLTRRKAIEVVAGLIWDKDKFLICQRPENKARGLLWEFPGGKGWVAVRWGDWKGLLRKVKEGNTQLELYDVRHDLLEEHDVAADHPDVVARMWEFIRASHTEPENPLFKMEIPEV